MAGHDPYVMKAIEYVLGLGFLLLFAGYWRWVMQDAAALRAAARAEVPGREVADPMFRVPRGVYLHPAHTWARFEPNEVAAVGMDDFAQRLVGPIANVLVPHIGARVSQGGPMAMLKADSKVLGLLSPVSGDVIAVNPEALRSPRSLADDPYGAGWLVKIATPRVPADRAHLVSGAAAERLLARAWDQLTTRMSPELGTVMHDGGVPVHGFARAIDEKHWDEIARTFLLN